MQSAAVCDAQAPKFLYKASFKPTIRSDNSPASTVNNEIALFVNIQCR